MKDLKPLFATLVLVLVLANAASAEEGVIYPWVTPPPPPPTNGATYPTSTAPGVKINDDTSIDLVTEMTLGIVQNLLTLF